VSVAVRAELAVSIAKTQFPWQGSRILPGFLLGWTQLLADRLLDLHRSPCQKAIAFHQ
jgi:hypothetical protein